MIRYEIYGSLNSITNKKEYRWRALGANNEIIAHGESYKNRSDVFHVIELLMNSYDAKIEIFNLKEKPLDKNL